MNKRFTHFDRKKLVLFLWGLFGHSGEENAVYSESQWDENGRLIIESLYQGFGFTFATAIKYLW